MENLMPKLNMLKRVGYLNATIETLKISNVELLPLGKSLRTQIEKHWQLSQPITTTIETISFNEAGCRSKEVDTRIQFVRTKLFRDNINALKQSKNFVPVKVKLYGRNLKFNESNPIKFNTNGNMNRTQLVTEHIFHESCGLAKLYKIQRERKIWWMKYSSDPSRYYLEPYKFPNDAAFSNAQSITVKSRFSFGDLAVEDITLVDLNDVELENKEDFVIYDEKTNKRQPPTVIRSVIDLDVATCALIFDGAANKKRDDTLFINRKIAPYQCQIIIESNDSCSSELKSLSKHISNVMIRAGLRVFQDDAFKISCKNDLENELADQLGIPYVIIVNYDSLNTGLLKLRSRDTTLKETIHLSDIPKYLLSIFCGS